MKKKTFALIGIVTFVFMSFSACLFANNNDQKNKIDNMVIGQITSITKSEVTIKLATRKDFDKDNHPMRASFSDAFGKDMKPPKDFDKNNSSNSKNENFKPKKDDNFEPPKDGNFKKDKKDDNFQKMDPSQMFTLSNETVKYDISSATFTSGIGDKKTLTYSDFKIGDYVEIETTTKDSKSAKKVRKFD